MGSAHYADIKCDLLIEIQMNFKNVILNERASKKKGNMIPIMKSGKNMKIYREWEDSVA